MIVIEVKIKDYDDGMPIVNRVPIKTSRTTEVEVISSNNRETFLNLCAQMWDQHNRTP